MSEEDWEEMLKMATPIKTTARGGGRRRDVSDSDDDVTPATTTPKQTKKVFSTPPHARVCVRVFVREVCGCVSVCLCVRGVGCVCVVSVWGCVSEVGNASLWFERNILSCV